MVIVKDRGAVGNWLIYHASTGATQYLTLNTTNAASTLSTVWNNTAPTSTVFSLGTAGSNFSGDTYVAYCFAAIAGYSAFGSYTGNGSTEGPFIYTGFRPRWVLLKVSSGGTDNWFLFDTSRDTYNVSGNYLCPSNSAAEGFYATLDFLSNGFKIRQSGTGINGSGYTYIYAAFAESPFQNSLAR
jgi:hypothetical protein